LTRVVSRATHGSTGAFDIDLTSGNGIECRDGSTNYQLVGTFSNTLLNVGSAGVTSGAGSVSRSRIDSTDQHNYLVNLGGITNQQYVTVTLSNVTDSAGRFSSTVTGRMGVLIGDVNGTGRVDAADVSLVRQQNPSDC